MPGLLSRRFPEVNLNLRWLTKNKPPSQSVLLGLGVGFYAGHIGLGVLKLAYAPIIMLATGKFSLMVTRSVSDGGIWYVAYAPRLTGFDGMLDQFAEIKAQHPDTVLFFRMGDFYEMFYEDAEIASEVLGITLTSRDKNADEPVPMAGVPWHSVESYLQGMLRAGHKVTLCEQEEELRPGSKILERVVTRVYTPGSLYEEDLIGEDGSSLLAGLISRGDGIGLAILDSSTGRAWLQEHAGAGRYERIRDELQRWSPSELVLGRREAESEEYRELLSSLDNVTMSVHEGGKEQHLQVVREHLDLVDLGSVDLDRKPLAMEACGLAAGYLCKVTSGRCSASSRGPFRC